MHSKYDIVIVGGGPAGSMAAWEAAKMGISVCILEKDKLIGTPVRCGEATSESGLKKFVEIKDSWIAEKITGRTFSELVQSWILNPLNMKNSYFNPPVNILDVIPPTEIDDLYRNKIVLIKKSVFLNNI